MKKYPKVVKYQLKRIHVIYANTTLHLFVSNFSLFLCYFTLICNYWCRLFDEEMLYMFCLSRKIWSKQLHSCPWVWCSKGIENFNLKLLDCNQLLYKAIEIKYPILSQNSSDRRKLLIRQLHKRLKKWNYIKQK